MDNDFVKGGYISSYFGAKNKADIYSGGINYGVDIAVPRGTVVTIPNGKWQVVKVFNKATAQGPNNSQRGINEGYGNQVVVMNLDTGEKISLAHLSSVTVRIGDLLNGGRIGYSGATGNVAGRTGNHVDIEYYNKAGRKQDVTKSSYWKGQQIDTVQTPKQGFSIVKPAMAAERNFSTTIVPTPPTKFPVTVEPVRNQVQPINFSPMSGGSSRLINTGDSLSKIAREYNTSWQNLAKLNPQIKDPNKIYVGDVLNVPKSRVYPIKTPVKTTGFSPPKKVSVNRVGGGGMS